MRRVFSMHFRRILRNDIIKLSLRAARIASDGLSRKTLSENNDCGDCAGLRSPRNIEPFLLRRTVISFELLLLLPSHRQIDRYDRNYVFGTCAHMQAARKRSAVSRLRVGITSSISNRDLELFFLRQRAKSGNKQAVDRGRREIVRLRCVGDRCDRDASFVAR